MRGIEFLALFVLIANSAMIVADASPTPKFKSVSVCAKIQANTLGDSVLVSTLGPLAIERRIGLSSNTHDLKHAPQEECLP